MTKHTLTVDAPAMRLDLFIGQKLALSRARLKALFEADVVKLTVPHPVTKRPITVESPLPPALAKVLSTSGVRPTVVRPTDN